MNEPFVPKQNFDGYYQKAQEIVQEVKDINDEIQATDEADFDRMKEVLETSRTTQLNLADSLKIVFERLDKLANLSEQKKKVKQLKDQYTREINRYKVIQKNLVEQGYEVRRQTLHRRSTQVQNPQKKTAYESTVTLKQSQIQQQQFEELIEIDQLEIDNAVIREKQEEITQIEKDAMVLNKIVNDMGQEVDKQGQCLDTVEINMANVKDNLKVVVKEMDGAQLEQRKTMKKYLYLGGIVIVLLAVIGVGIYYWKR